MSDVESAPKSKKRTRTAKAKTGFEPSSPNANGTGVSKRKKRDELANELLVELKQLRSNVDDMVEHYRLRIGGEIADLVQHVEGNRLEGRARRPAAKTSTALLSALRAETLKPKKGRAKDFARLQKLVRTLADLLPPED